MFDLKTYYENFSLDNPTVSVTVIIWALCIGLCVGSIFYTFARHSCWSLIKSLKKGEHSTKDKAVSLSELGLRATLLLKRDLKDGQSLRKYVCIANPEECRLERKNKFINKVYRHFRKEDMPVKYDLSKALFYLPEESRHTAEVRYESKGSPILAAIVACVLFGIVAVGLSLCMPKLLELLDEMITAYKNLR